jgi:hypothetical protein
VQRKKEKPTAQSSTFYFARTTQNKKSLPFPNSHSYEMIILILI